MSAAVINYDQGMGRWEPALFQERREGARQRQAVIAANAELQERELIKLASLASALADAASKSQPRAWRSRPGSLSSGSRSNAGSTRPARQTCRSSSGSRSTS